MMTHNAILLLLAAFAVSSVACSTVRPGHAKVETRALAPAKGGVLAKTSLEVRSKFGAGRSGFHLLTEADEALHWRLALVDHATESIDIQYYLWQNDDAGWLLFSRLLDAADRGVRVRILVDDFLYKGDEEKLAAVCHHPNLDIRIFNPRFTRSGILQPALEFAFRFGELNRRMHNKLFVADNRIAIMGGRNIGNVYFGLGKKYNFIDLDVLTAGTIVPEISQAFDVFWNSEPAVPGQGMAHSAPREKTERLMAGIRARLASRPPGLLAETDYPLERKDWSANFRRLRTKWHTGTAMVLQDEPVTDPRQPRRRFLEHAPSVLDTESPEELFIVTPYLIPGDGIYDSIAERVKQNVRVRLLVPGLGSTNQALVHSHYKKHRHRLLAEGAELREFREQPSQPVRDLADKPPVRSKVVALHLKGAVGDRKRCFIGSLNLDPRSIEINTENGLFIESPGLARELANHFERLASTENAWVVSADEDGLVWRSRGEEVRRQPAPGTGKRVWDFFFGLLPIEGLL